MSTKSTTEEAPPVTAFITYRLYRLAQLATRAGQRWHHANSGLTLNEWRVLAMLVSFGDSTGAKLAARLPMDKAAISRTKSAMVTRGLLREAPAATDSRKRVLIVTPAGRRLFDRIWPLVQARQARIASALDAKDRAAFARIEAKLAQHFAADDGEGARED